MPRTTLETKVYTKNWPLCFVNWPAPAPVSYSFVFSCFNHHVNFSKNRYEKISVSYPTLGFKLITTKEGVLVCSLQPQYYIFTMSHSRPLFFLLFSLFSPFQQFKVKAWFADDWIQTVDLWRRRQLLCQLSHNLCPYSC